MQGGGWVARLRILKKPCVSSRRLTKTAARAGKGLDFPSLALCGYHPGPCATWVRPLASCSFSAPARSSTSSRTSRRIPPRARETGGRPERARVAEAGTRTADRVAAERAAMLVHHQKAAREGPPEVPLVTAARAIPAGRRTRAARRTPVAPAAAP